MVRHITFYPLILLPKKPNLNDLTIQIFNDFYMPIFPWLQILYVLDGN